MIKSDQLSELVGSSMKLVSEHLLDSSPGNSCLFLGQGKKELFVQQCLGHSCKEGQRWEVDEVGKGVLG